MPKVYRERLWVYVIYLDKKDKHFFILNINMQWLSQKAPKVGGNTRLIAYIYICSISYILYILYHFGCIPTT